MNLRTILIATTLLASSAAALETGTAFHALKALPKGQAKNVARIEARDGTPAPERWHVLVHDGTADRGLREYVIAAGEVVASRTISQFADKLTEGDVIAGEALKIDSDRAAQIALQYALVNEAHVASINYQLKREGAEAAPLWKITCLDEKGTDLGVLVLTASRGIVVSHPGFNIEPKTDTEIVGEEFTPQGSTPVVSSVTPTATKAAPRVKKKVSSNAKKKTRKRTKEPKFFQRAGGTLKKFFGGS